MKKVEKNTDVKEVKKSNSDKKSKNNEKIDVKSKEKKVDGELKTKKSLKKNEKEKTVSVKKINTEFENNEDEIKIVKIESTSEVNKKETKKKIKLNDLLLIIGLVVVVILGCFVMGGEKVEPSYELPLQLTGDAGLKQLTYAEYQEKIDNDESFVLIIERATCSHCVTFMPIAKAFAEENNVPMYYVDTDTFSAEDWEGFEKSNTFLKKNSGEWGTPTTVVLAGKEAVDYIEGTTSADSLLELYNEYFEMN